MMKRSIIATTIILALMIALCGCATYDSFKEAFIEDPEDTSTGINIGIYEPMSGSDKDAALPEIQGIELAHKLAPQVCGKDVHLIYADNSSDINAAETAIDTLTKKNPAVILGSYGNLYSLLAADYVEEAKVPSITMTNTNPLITRNNSYYFRICYRDETQGRLLANYLNSIDADCLGVLTPEDDDAATALATAFTNGFEDLSEKDDTLHYYMKYPAGTEDFSQQLEKLKEKTDVKYVLLPGDTKDVLNIINQAAAMKLNVTFLGDMSWGSEDFQKGLGSDVDPKQLAFVQFFATDGDDEKDTVSESRQLFLDAYAKEYPGKEPEESVALGYDAYMIALDAIEKATETSSTGSSKIAGGEAIRDLLLSEGYTFEGASGSIQFNKVGDPKKTAYISTWDKDSISAIYTIEAKDQ